MVERSFTHLITEVNNFITFFSPCFLNQVLRDQVALHLKDIERMKDAGRNLADSKPDLQTDINRTNGKDIKSSLFKKLKKY